MPLQDKDAPGRETSTLKEARLGAFLLPVSDYPVPEPELERVKACVQDLVQFVGAELGLGFQLLLQWSHFHLGDAAELVRINAPAWKPGLGLGVWPNRPAPTRWTQEDFTELGIGEVPRAIMNPLLCITAEPDVRLKACQTMLGMGTAVLVFTSDDRQTYLKRTRELLFPPIKDPLFTAFDFYAPLLEVQSIRGAGQKQLQEWCCGASVYVRESFEDKGILILSNVDLSPFVRKYSGLDTIVLGE